MITTAKECEDAAKILNLQDFSTLIVGEDIDLHIDDCKGGCMYGCTHARSFQLRFGSPESPWYPAHNAPCGSRYDGKEYDCICKYTGKIILIENRIYHKTNS